MTPDPRPLALAALLAAVACGGGAAAVEALPPVPARATRATLVGPLCQGDGCRCREGDDDAGAPEAGGKRFEVRLGPSEHELWATVDGMTLYKDREEATRCFYLDLRPGVHPVALRGASDEVVGFQAAIAEQGGASDEVHGERRAWWYDTFAFACGAPGACDRASLDELVGGLRGKRGKLDPCGSTRVKEVGWHTGRLPDHGRPTDLQVSLELHVYAFAPKHPPGDPACAGGGGAKDGE